MGLAALVGRIISPLVPVTAGADDSTADATKDAAATLLEAGAEEAAAALVAAARVTKTVVTELH